jgi:hypothetical protein
MNRFQAAALAAAVLLVSQSVSAQTPAPAAAQPKASEHASMLDDLTIGVAGGVTFTKKTGGFVGGEVVSGKEYWKNTTFSIEGGWMSSVVNAHRIDSAAAIASYLAQTQGQPASATVKVPAGYGAVNVRRTVMIKPRYKVYVLGGGGIGVTSPKTKFTLGGSDVSGSLGQYGVTLGKDLAGSSAGGLLNVGLGATMPHGKWVGDASYRLTPIFSAGETTVVNRLNFGVGYKF